MPAHLSGNIIAARNLSKVAFFSLQLPTHRIYNALLECGHPFSELGDRLVPEDGVASPDERRWSVNRLVLRPSAKPAYTADTYNTEGDAASESRHATDDGVETKRSDSEVSIHAGNHAEEKSEGGNVPESSRVDSESPRQVCTKERGMHARDHERESIPSGETILSSSEFDHASRVESGVSDLEEQRGNAEQNTRQNAQDPRQDEGDVSGIGMH